MAQQIKVDRIALAKILRALGGPVHWVRELQATRSLDLLRRPEDPERNPINVLFEQFNDPTRLVAAESSVPQFTWSAPAPPDEQIRYDHVSAQTPFGRILITWKSWKSHALYTVDEVPGNEDVQAVLSASELEDTQRLAEAFYIERVRAAAAQLTPSAEQLQAATDPVQLRNALRALPGDLLEDDALRAAVGSPLSTSQLSLHPTPDTTPTPLPGPDMSASNDQVTQGLRVLLRSHPTLLPLREIAVQLTDVERAVMEQSLVDFLTSDSAFDCAVDLRVAAGRAAKGKNT